MRILNRALFAALAVSLLSFTASVQAQVFSEAAGDFSNDANAPTDLGTFAAGISTISGTSQSGSEDRDHVTFSVASGFEITSIQINEFAPTAGGGSFLGFANDSVISSSAGDFLFAGLVNVGSADPALDLIAEGAGSFGGQGFPTTLGAGDYSFLFNETGAVDANYSAQITVAASVPEPSSAIVLAGLGLLAARRRRKS